MPPFGKHQRTYNHKTGTFYCPRCEKSVQYRHKKQRQFFYLCWLPLYPLKTESQYIQCCSCLEKFKTKILKIDSQGVKSNFEDQFQEILIDIMIAMMISDGEVEDQEVDAIQKTYKKLTGQELKATKIWKKVSQSQVYGQHLFNKLKKLNEFLSQDGRKMAVKAARLVAAADGELQEEERELIIRIGESLNLERGEINKVIAKTGN